MNHRGNVFLMYHELERSGRALCQSEPGYVRYVLREDEFAGQMTFLRDTGWRGMSVGEALAGPADKAIVITFDDGCETDLALAAPILRQHGFTATFYVTAGCLGQQGYLSHEQVRQLVAEGFEVGCHSMTHAYLPELTSQQLDIEIAGAKRELEQTLGRSVHHFSCPGGQYDTRVIATAKASGYKTVATSEVRRNRAGTDPFRLGRVAVLRGMPLALYSQICDGSILWKLRLRDGVKRTAKRVLGNSAYDRMRGVLLGKSSG